MYKKPRIVWGSTPIVNNHYWSSAMKKAGYKSETFTLKFYKSINKREDWDRILDEEYTFFPYYLRHFIAFVDSLFKYDIFFLSCDGFFIGNTPVRYFQAMILKLAGKKIIIIPYGADAYVYRDIRSASFLHAAQISYPDAARKQDRLSKNVRYWVRNADAVIPGFMGPDGFGRWDTLINSPLFLDLDMWSTSERYNDSTGTEDEVVIAHAPNHRGLKGTEFVLEAVELLKNEGLNVRLYLIEGIQNDQVKEILRNKVDILVEQLIFNGHGMNALEGMASGLPTVSNLEDKQYIDIFRRWSYLDECPLVSASPESLADVLRILINNPLLRQELGKLGRLYVEKYHGLDSCIYLMENTINYVLGNNKKFSTLYHPLLGEYTNRLPKIKPSLVNNKLV